MGRYVLGFRPPEVLLEHGRNPFRWRRRPEHDGLFEFVSDALDHKLNGLIIHVAHHSEVFREVVETRTGEMTAAQRLRAQRERRRALTEEAEENVE